MHKEIPSKDLKLKSGNMVQKDKEVYVTLENI